MDYGEVTCFQYKSCKKKAEQSHLTPDGNLNIKFVFAILQVCNSSQKSAGIDLGVTNTF